MDFWDGFHIDDACFEKDKFFEAKTNIKRKRILSYFGLPDSEERIVYYKGTGIMIVFLDYWDYNSKIDLWENGKTLHLRGTKEYDLENDINKLNIKDNALYFLDRNDIAVHLFWAEEKDKYRYGHVMVPQNRPYQIQELSENGTLKFVWRFPLLPVDVSYKMEDKYSFYGANKIKGYSKKFIKKQAEEIGRNDIEDTLMIKDISNITFDLNLRSFQNYTEPHHLIPMAYSDKFKVSLDVEANIVSLCSTCHNHIHYGVGAKDLLTSLYYQRINRLRAVGLDISLEELLQMYDIK